MNAKTYSLQAGTETVTYGYSIQFRKWIYRVGTHTLLVKCKGVAMGHKVANIVGGAVKRTGTVDNMARANIAKLTA
jgi:hypothetical protein